MDSTKSVTQIKSELRRRFRAEREFLVTDSDWEHLLESHEVNAASVIASYFSYGDEPSTHALNKSLIAAGKKVLLPRLREDKDLDWVPWSGRDEDLTSQGLVSEPIGNTYTGEIDVVIVPALMLIAKEIDSDRVAVLMIARLRTPRLGKLRWFILANYRAKTCR